MDEIVKGRLLERFAEYLDGFGELEETETTEFDQDVDLYTLFIELAGLKNEIKLESRQVKHALDHSRELMDALQQSSLRLNKELSELRQDETALREEAERELLLGVLELRDRIEASVQGIQGFKPGKLFNRAHGRVKKMIDGVEQGLDISLRRIDGLLSRYQVRPVSATGQQFDPEKMRAASIASDPEQQNGIVLNEIRKGYQRADKALRFAEVEVNKQETSA